MTQKHTAAPWQWVIVRKDEWLVGADYQPIGPSMPSVSRAGPEARAVLHANAARIVACVNALEGVSTDDLERVAARFPNDPAARLSYLADVAAEAQK